MFDTKEAVKKFVKLAPVTEQEIADVFDRIFFMGWEHGVTQYAVWKDGTQYVGILQKPLHAVLKEGPK